MISDFLPQTLKEIRRGLVWLLCLLVVAALTGCGISKASTNLTVATVSPVASPRLTDASVLPSPTSAPDRPTRTPILASTATRQSNESAVASATATATDSVPTPTATPVPVTSTPTPDELVAAGCDCQIEHIVIISIDGLRPDALEQANTPVLDGLRATGAYSPQAQAVLPSVTLVNHASMLSGMSPEKHGIYWNVNDPELGKVKGPTLFSVAHEAGLSTAMVVGKPKLEHLVLPDSVDTYIYAGFTDSQVVAEALPVIKAGLPDLLFIHLPDVDSAGHVAGWMSLVQILAIGRTDSLIGEIVAQLETEGYLDTTLLVITSDHGGKDKQHGSDIPENVTVPWLAVGPGVPQGMTLDQEIITYDTAATALYAFGLPIPDTWDGQPVLEIFGDQPLITNEHPIAADQ